MAQTSSVILVSGNVCLYCITVKFFTPEWRAIERIYNDTGLRQTGPNESCILPPRGRHKLTYSILECTQSNTQTAHTWNPYTHIEYPSSHTPITLIHIHTHTHPSVKLLTVVNASVIRYKIQSGWNPQMTVLHSVFFDWIGSLLKYLCSYVWKMFLFNKCILMKNFKNATRWQLYRFCKSIQRRTRKPLAQTVVFVLLLQAHCALVGMTSDLAWYHCDLELVWQDNSLASHEYVYSWDVFYILLSDFPTPLQLSRHITCMTSFKNKKTVISKYIYV